MKLLAFVPARGGSKSIPNKNLYKILNKPLIQYTLETLKKLAKR
jgi:CMP-N-acetylneuraminic acid synthetase